jgi:hypothetical protein
MKKTRKTLSLTRETLRELAPADLSQALGGAFSEFCTRLACPSWHCPPPPSQTCPQ